MAEPEGLVTTRDVFVIIGTICQTAIALLALCYVNLFRERKKRKEDQERERQKADRENIAAILSQEYDDVVGIYKDLKNEFDRLKRNTINENITEFDVLVYMCHPDKREKYQPESPSYKSWSPPKARYKDISSVISDVDKVMKLFLHFRFKLSTLHEKKCPDDLREVFSETITEMAQTIYPFATPSRQKVLKAVLTYFGSDPVHPVEVMVEGRIPCCSRLISCLRSCCSLCRMCKVVNDEELVSNEEVVNDEEVVSNEEGNQGLQPYLGHDNIEENIPYFEFFSYENCQMKVVIECANTNLKCLEEFVEKKKENVMNTEEELRAIISNILDSTSSQGDLLHLIRQVMLKKLDISDADIQNLDDYVRRIESGQRTLDMRVNASERKLDLVERYVYDLRNSRKSVLANEETPEFLGGIAEQLRAHICPTTTNI